jgi:hypothetical protein
MLNSVIFNEYCRSIAGPASTLGDRLFIEAVMCRAK